MFGQHILVTPTQVASTKLPCWITFILGGTAEWGLIFFIDDTASDINSPIFSWPVVQTYFAPR